MTEPEQWAVVQEVETVTGDFLTEPGVPFYRIVIDGYCADFDHRQAAENFVAAIQRAFEEQTRDLREALIAVRDEGMRNHNTRCKPWWNNVLQALATRQPTPTEGTSHDQ